MKFFNQSKTRTVPTEKPRQQMMMLLESRRMMSLTGAVDFTPTAEASAPAQITHSFGFEHTLPDSGDARPPMPMDADFGGGQPDFSAFEAQFARAIAQGATMPFVDPNVTNAPDLMSGVNEIAHAAHANTLTSMYNTLSNSTVMSIDAAATVSSADAALDAVGDTAIHASIAVASTDALPAATISANPGLTLAATAVGSTSDTAVTIDPTLATPTAFTPVINPLITSGNSVTTADASPRISLQTVEQEFLTVSTLASEMVSQLGRDIAIELSHLGSDLSFESMNEQLTTHWDGLRSAAAVTGAAIATIVYLQSESDRDKTKGKTVFSTNLIEAVAT